MPGKHYTACHWLSHPLHLGYCAEKTWAHHGPVFEETEPDSLTFSCYWFKDESQTHEAKKEKLDLRTTDEAKIILELHSVPGTGVIFVSCSDGLRVWWAAGSRTAHRTRDSAWTHTSCWTITPETLWTHTDSLNSSSMKPTECCWESWLQISLLRNSTSFLSYSSRFSLTYPRWCWLHPKILSYRQSFQNITWFLGV